MGESYIKPLIADNKKRPKIVLATLDRPGRLRTTDTKIFNHFADFASLEFQMISFV